MTRPRVLILSTYYFPVLGGSETHARQVARYLQREGYGVLVMTKRVGHAALRDEMIDGVPVHRLPPAGARSAAQKWLMTPFVFAEMMRRYRDFDVVFLPDYRGIGIAGLLAAHLLGKPVVLSTAALGVINGNNIAPALARLGIPADGALARAIKWPIRALYSSGEAYAAITHAIAHEAIAAGVQAHRVHYLPNSVDTTVFRPAETAERQQLRATFGMRDDEVACLFLARLSQEKGLMDLMAAWPMVTAPNARLFVVGPDMSGHPMDVGPKARAFVETHGLRDRIIFAGPTTAASDWLRAADLLIQPSHWEGAPFGIIEAMASGLPIVATRVGGMAEVLTDGVTALLCDPLNPPALASAITRLIAAPGLRATMAAASRRLAEQEFDEAVICSRYAAVFEGVAAAAAAASA